MTAPESSADLLRRAADRLDQLATAATGERWEASAKYPEAWTVEARWPPLPPPPRRGVRNPPERHHTVVEESGDGDVPEHDARYIAAMGPQVAAPLAAWLRTEADKADGPIARDIAAGRVRIDMPAAQPSPALVFARALLGEEETP